MRCPLVTLALVLSLPAVAVTLDDARVRAQRSAQQVQALEQSQTTLRQQLEATGARIESLKERERGRLIVGSELDTALRDSQTLSGQLTDLARSLENARRERDEALRALLSSLDGEIDAAWNRWRQSAGPDRTQAASRIRSLRAERNKLRRSLPSANVPNVAPASSDDPDDLLEEADALLDAEDKARKRLAAIDARIHEEQREQDLDRRLGDLVSDQAAFDDSDRNLRGAHDPHEALPHNTLGPGPVMAGGPATPPGSSSAAPAPPLPTTGSTGTLIPPPNIPAGGPLPEIGAMDLRQLQSEKARLQSMADSLHAKAAQVESRAREQR